MAKVTVSIPYVVWRDGRPRFVPGATVRALGFKGEDLKHPCGEFYSLAETQAWATAKIAEIAARKAGAPKPPIARGAVYTVEDLFDDLWRSMRFRVPRAEGGLSEKTKADYKKKANVLKAFDPELWTSPAAAITKPIALGLHERLWEEKGLAMANGIVAVLRLAISEAIARGRGGVKLNPLFDMHLPTPKARVRIGTQAEIEALLKVADSDDPDVRDPEIGDAIVLALYTGQRQGDVLYLCDREEREGRVRFVQSKTNARVGMRALPPLMARIRAGRDRKLTDGLHEVAEVVVDRRTREAFNEHSFRHRFAAVRAAAAKACPSVATLWFMDLRDTAVTRLAWAGCTIPEIAAITGHSLDTIHAVLKHYLELDEAHADAAMDKLQAWLEREGIAL